MAPSNRDRPNILYMMTDQQKASASSVNGNPYVPTPFMDDMAARGVTFLDAYTANPICTPSRTTVMTGVHPLVHQVTCHQNRAPYNVAQLPELLRDSGYYTAAIGHYEQDRNLTRGWYEQVSREESGGPLGDALHRAYAHGSRDHGWSSGPLDYSFEEGHAFSMTTRAIDMLNGIEAFDQPFFFHVPYNEPHPPYFIHPPYDTMVDPDSLPVPEQGGEERPDWQAAAREQLGSDRATDADLRKLVAHYYGMIAYAASQMQRLYDEMARRGLLHNTWVIIGSDHGDYTGEKGLFMKSESLYECLLHVCRWSAKMSG